MATYTIGSDGGDDYATWAAFTGAITPSGDDSITFRKGDTFTETVTMTASGTSGHVITFGAHGTGADPIITGSDTREYCIYGNGYDYLTFDGLDCRDSTNINISFGNNSTNITVQNCSTTGADAAVNFPAGSGIYFGTGCTTTVVDNLTSDSNSGWGLAHRSSGNLTLKNSTISNNATMGIRIQSTGTIIEYNTIDNNGTDAATQHNMYNEATNAVIRYNIIKNSVGTGIDTSQGADVYYNLVYGNGQGIACTSENTGIDVYNNVVYNNNYGIYIGGTNSTIANLKNNIIFGNVLSGQYRFQIFGYAGWEGEITNSDYNLVWGDGSASQDICYYKGTDHTWTEWKARGEGFDVHSLNEDPKVTDAVGSDFHILSNSPCIDVGTDVSLSTDYYGNSVPEIDGYDIGAHEYPAALGSSDVYYVDTNSSGGDGTTTATAGAQAAWTNISDIAGLAASDSLLFNRGCTWRETLTVSVAGVSGDPHIIGAYGAGADPIISGADIISTWTAYTADYNYGSEDAADNSVRAANRVVAGSVTMSSRGGVVKEFKLSAFENDGDSVLCSIYADSGGSPAAQVANTTSAEMATLTAGWNTAAVTSGATLTASTAYHISYWTEGNMKAGEGAGGDSISSLKDDTVYGGAWPDPFSSDGSDDNIKGFYVTIIETIPNVWKATVATEPEMVMFDGTVGTNVASAILCNGAGKWFWESNVLHVYYTEDPDGAVVIDAGARDNQIFADSKDYITIDGIQCEGSNRGGGNSGSIRLGSCDSAIVTNCVFLNNGDSGVYVSKSDNVTVSNNTFTYCHGEAIQFITDDAGEHCDGGVISGNTVHDCWKAGINLYGTDGTKQITGCDVYSNTVYDSGCGIYLHWADSCNIYSNTLYDNTVDDAAYENYGLALRESSSNSLYQNTIYGNDYHGIELWGASGSQCDSNLIYRNLIYGNGLCGLQTGTDYCDSNEIYYNIFYGNGAISSYPNVRLGGANTGNTFYNNVCYDCQDNDEIDFVAGTTGYTVKNNIFFVVTATTKHCLEGNTTTNITHSNNCYYKASGDIILYNGTGYDASEIASFEATAVNSDPSMTNPGAADFTLQFGSPCINRGAHVAILLDYGGTGYPVPIGHVSDIGAYEHKNGGHLI